MNRTAFAVQATLGTLHFCSNAALLFLFHQPCKWPTYPGSRPEGRRRRTSQWFTLCGTRLDDLPLPHTTGPSPTPSMFLHPEGEHGFNKIWTASVGAELASGGANHVAGNAKPQPKGLGWPCRPEGRRLNWSGFCPHGIRHTALVGVPYSMGGHRWSLGLQESPN